MLYNNRTFPTLMLSKRLLNIFPDGKTEVCRGEERKPTLTLTSFLASVTSENIRNDLQRILMGKLPKTLTYKKGNTTEFWFLPCNFNHLNFLEI